MFASQVLRERGVHILAIVGKPECGMAKVSDAILTYQVDHPLEEPIGGVPTTSVMLQVGHLVFDNCSHLFHSSCS